MAAKDPEKKMPSTDANATSLSANDASELEIHFNAQSAFFLTHGTTEKILRHFKTFGTSDFICKALFANPGFASITKKKHFVLSSF